MISELLQKMLGEVLLDIIAEKVKGAVAGGWVCFVIQSELHPYLTFADGFKDLAIVVG